MLTLTPSLTRRHLCYTRLCYSLTQRLWLDHRKPPRDRDSPPPPSQCRQSSRWDRQSSHPSSASPRTHPWYSQPGGGKLAVDHMCSKQRRSHLCCRAVLVGLIVLEEAALCLQIVTLDNTVLDFSGPGRHRFGETYPGIGTKYKTFVRKSIVKVSDLFYIISAPHCFSLINSHFYNLWWPWEWLSC